VKPAVQASSRAAWLPAGAARALHWWDAETAHAVGQSFGAALRDWGDDWGWPGALPEVEPRAPSPPGEWQGAWQAFERDGRPVAWALVPAQAADDLLGGFFPGLEGLGPVARAFACACEQDAFTRLAAVLAAARAVLPAAPSAQAWRAGAGAMELRLGPPFHWRMLLDATVVSGWRVTPPRRAAPTTCLALTAIDAALARHRLDVQVALEGCELELAALQALQPGDVVRLRHRVDQSAALRDATGSTLCRAYLGRCRGRVAVELAAG
jgi:hypothetical protein